MKRFIGSRKGIALLAVSTAVVLSSGVAVAYFTSSGQGAGTAAVGTNTAWAIAQGATTGAAALTPGGPSQTIAYTVTNNSAGHQLLHQVTIEVAGSTGTSPTATPTVYSHGLTGNPCTKDDFSLGGGSQGVTKTVTVDIDLAPAGVYNGSVIVAMTNHVDTSSGGGQGNQDNCKNENPPLFYAAS